MKTIGKFLRTGLIVGVVLAVCAAVLPGVTRGEAAPDAVGAKTVLFKAGQKGYVTFRIPGLVVTPRGSVLAYCAARRFYSDWADIDVAMRRSSDGGQTWSPMRILAQGDGATADNPVAIPDRVTGAVHFIHQVDYGRAYYLRSDDDGVTFCAPEDITYVFNEFRKDYDWTVLAPGPGHGIQLQNGRLLIPVWLANGGGQAHRPSCVSTIYSDDHGQTWQRGEIVANDGDKSDDGRPIKNPNETTAAELPDGTVMLNLRNESPTRRRLIATSADGATGWSTPRFDDALFEPICFAGFVSMKREGKSDLLIFSNPDSSDKVYERDLLARGRKNLTIKVSSDNGQNWSNLAVVEPGIAGYSDLSAGPNGRVFILYESDGVLSNAWLTKELVFASVKVD